MNYLVHPGVERDLAETAEHLALYGSAKTGDTLPLAAAAWAQAYLVVVAPTVSPPPPSRHNVRLAGH